MEEKISSRPDPEVERGMVIIGLLVGIPIVGLFALAALLKVIGPYLPILLVLLLVGLGIYGYLKFRSSPLTVRREHEAEVLDLLGRAEQQQRSLPEDFPRDLMVKAFETRGISGASLPPMTYGVLQAIYAEEFLRTLPPMPGVPLEPERVYDVEYDRRTLKKGEEPPYRLRTDSRGRPTSLELEAFKDWLHRFVASTTNVDATLYHFANLFADCVGEPLKASLAIGGGAGDFTVPLVDLLPDAKRTLTRMIAPLFDRKARDWHHFSSVRDAYERNRERISTTELRLRDLAIGAVLDPTDFSGSGREAIDAYLADTPLLALLLAPIPFAVPLAKRFEGHLIVARQGSGKTNALECLIARDLEEVAAGRASVVVMDSQGLAADTLIGRLATLDAFSPGRPLHDKLIYLEPDIEFPLALNIFDIGLRQMGRLTATQREDIVSSAIEVVEFLFTGLLGGELSDNMTMLYRYLVPAMLAIPNADMNTFIELLDSDGGRDQVPAGFAKYRHHFADLEPEVRSFLEQDYIRDVELLKTKAAVRRRLRAALADTTFRRMFTQPRNKLNLFTELQSAKVILVNTYPAKTYVEQFGRLILALLMQATRQRLEIDRDQRMPTFVYLDECQDYIAREDRIARYIDKCRKQNVGLVFAHQRLANIESPKVLNALAGVSIKFSGVSDADASDLAAMVGSTADHIRALARGQFAAFVSGVTPHAVDITFPKSPLEHADRISAAAFAARRTEMRAKYATQYGAGGATSEPPIYEGTYTETRPAPRIRDHRDGDNQDGASAPSAGADDYDPLQ
ncbi:hypothetical protein [Devosia sp.]|uniref:hypothetical protein n=1 Tax=Devosia sp. TaxID=1871048 RepID=UPI001ACC49F0|nr:hypothetical protein [Devosia sp.]MBN9309668.1 hypothetical protein [Devosia sp.]